jgi:large subunit ribosomal protein L15
MRLDELSPASGACHVRKRRGRGQGSGNGTYGGRGLKGQRSRSGGGVRPGFEGGQMPLHRRLPKRGFTNIFKKQIAVINVKDLARFEANTEINEKLLVHAGLVKGKWDAVKLLGQGEIDFPLQIKLSQISKAARDKILKAGGTILEG